MGSNYDNSVVTLVKEMLRVSELIYMYKEAEATAKTPFLAIKLMEKGIKMGLDALTTMEALDVIRAFQYLKEFKE